MPPHSLYKKSQSLISEGPALWGDSILSPWRPVAMLCGKQLQLAGGLGPASPSPLDATGAELGVDSSDLAGLYRHGRRPPERVGRNLSEGHATHLERPDRSGPRAAGFS